MNDVVTRYPGNPILTASDIPYPCWRCFNPAATKFGDQYLLLVRTQNEDGAESLGLALSDDGYHFAVDRAGNVWQARPLQFQGAHVKDHNEGNIGIVALGNFEQQRPTQAQVEAVHRHAREMMVTFNVPPSRLRTHQEWAATACPGRHMQRVLVASRSSGRFG